MIARYVLGQDLADHPLPPEPKFGPGALRKPYRRSADGCHVNTTKVQPKGFYQGLASFLRQAEKPASLCYGDALPKRACLCLISCWLSETFGEACRLWDR